MRWTIFEGFLRSYLIAAIVMDTTQRQEELIPAIVGHPATSLPLMWDLAAMSG